MGKDTLGKENRQIFASRYKLHLPSAKEMAEKIWREHCELDREQME